MFCFQTLEFIFYRRTAAEKYAKSNGFKFTAIKKLSSCTVTFSGVPCTYSGTEQKPSSVTVKDGTKLLKVNTDYYLTYTNNINAGTASVTVTGIEANGYTGNVTKYFTINPKSIAGYCINSDILPRLRFA